MCIEQLYIELRAMSHFYASRFFMIFLIVCSIHLKYIITDSALSQRNESSVVLANRLVLKDIEKLMFFPLTFLPYC